MDDIFEGHEAIARSRRIILNRRAWMSVVNEIYQLEGLGALCPPEMREEVFAHFEEGDAAEFIETALIELIAAYVAELDKEERIRLTAGLYARSPAIFRKLLEGF